MSDRIHSIDSLRAVAMFFIVIAHAKPFVGYQTYGNHVYFVLDTIGQFDVPFFFVTSGYFLAGKIGSNTVKSYLTGSVRKVGSIYVFGLGLYLVTTTAIALLQGVNVMNALVARRLGNLTIGNLLYYGNGVAVPLWFLTALFFSLSLASLFVAFDRTPYLLPVAAMVHVVGLLGTNYPMVLDVPVLKRDALFFGFFYVALGYHIKSANWSPDGDQRWTYLSLFCLCVGFQLVEQYAIGYLIRDNALNHAIYSTEYTVATVFLVLTLFLWALSNPEWGEGTRLPTVGKYAVGIYLVHVPMLRLFQAVNSVFGPRLGIDFTTTLLWQLLSVPTLYLLSLVAYLLMAAVGIIEIGGSHLPWLDTARLRVRESSTDVYESK